MQHVAAACERTVLSCFPLLSHAAATLEIQLKNFFLILGDSHEEEENEKALLSGDVKLVFGYQEK